MSDLKTEKTPEEKLAIEVEEDFLRRREERRTLERGWQLNMNFVCGNQYCGLDAAGELYEEGERYYWQHRRVFNHIAPTMDVRLSKLSRIRPSLVVRAASEEESDRFSASLASALLSAAQEDLDLDGVISSATLWSEICGTAFYKVMWNAEGGRAVGVSESGKKLREGNVSVAAVSPFEIYPLSLSVEEVCDQPSIIHAKALSVEEIYALYGVKLVGRDVDEFSLAPFTSSGCAEGARVTAVRHGYEIVIERYEKPTAERLNGRLTVVAGGKLLYDGELPYMNGNDGDREYPFVKQTSIPLAGSFFGLSVVERLIPLQRAYNAVKNRKHEFMNRLALGVAAVEDGSVDADELAEEGLEPGKIIVYRQGSTPPKMLDSGGVPEEFGKEEENLLAEFMQIAGASDLKEGYSGFSGITSATGLQLLIEQDDRRLSVTYSSIKRAVKQIGRHILRLYRQFATDVRLLRYAGKNNVLSLYYFKGSDISSDDVVLEADSEVNTTPAQKRNTIYEILDKGLFTGEDGKLSVSAKNRLLELLGYASLAGERDLGELNRARAGEENLKMRTGSVEVKDYDDHVTHITEHTAFLLSEELDKDTEKRISAHVARHKRMIYAGQSEQNDNSNKNKNDKNETPEVK